MELQCGDKEEAVDLSGAAGMDEWNQSLSLERCLSACMCLQVIMELQCGGEAEAVDLSGDAGVVGRWLVQGDEDSPQLCMDLKGVLFSATTVRPSLACGPLWWSAP